MILAGLKKLLSDYSAFAKNLGTDQVVIVIVYVDDFLFFGLDIAEINSIKRFLSETFKMKDLRPCGQFTGIKIECQIEEKTISLSKEIYFQKTLEHPGLSDCKPVHYLVVVNTDYTKDPQEPTDKEFNQTYQSHIGTHMWA